MSNLTIAPCTFLLDEDETCSMAGTYSAWEGRVLCPQHEEVGRLSEVCAHDWAILCDCLAHGRVAWCPCDVALDGECDADCTCGCDCWIVDEDDVACTRCHLDRADLEYRPPRAGARPRTPMRPLLEPSQQEVAR